MSLYFKAEQILHIKGNNSRGRIGSLPSQGRKLSKRVFMTQLTAIAIWNQKFSSATYLIGILLTGQNMKLAKIIHGMLSEHRFVQAARSSQSRTTCLSLIRCDLSNSCYFPYLSRPPHYQSLNDLSSIRSDYRSYQVHGPGFFYFLPVSVIWFILWMYMYPGTDHKTTFCYIFSS